MGRSAVASKHMFKGNGEAVDGEGHVLNRKEVDLPMSGKERWETEWFDSG